MNKPCEREFLKITPVICTKLSLYDELPKSLSLETKIITQKLVPADALPRGVDTLTRLHNPGPWEEILLDP